MKTAEEWLTEFGALPDHAPVIHVNVEEIRQVQADALTFARSLIEGNHYALLASTVLEKQIEALESNGNNLPTPTGLTERPS